MTRSVTLNALKAGISRLRTKGGADPQTLYDLRDGYVTLAGTVEQRPGSRIDATMPPVGTKGLCAHKGKLIVFAAAPAVVPAGYVLEVLIHPTGASTTLKYIHFAESFMGSPYVAAEWDNGDVVHYWLQTTEAWQANHVYTEGAVVRPSTANGYGYVAERLGGAAKPWAPSVSRTIGDKIEPTKPDGFDYTVTDVQGANPRSGLVEPVWNAITGAVTYEDADNEPPPSADGTDGVPDTGTGGRYDNPGGNRPPGGTVAP